jgi:imidazolonepropionase
MQNSSYTKADLLISPIGELATPKQTIGPVRGSEMREVLRISDAAIAIRRGKIIAAGKRIDIDGVIEINSDTLQIDASNKLVTPGLVDPHTHLIFGGNRSDEFTMRCAGKSYREIANAGGGIVASMKGTREASSASLFTTAEKRLALLSEHGTTTCEIKTGYGLDTESELSLLELIFRLGCNRTLNIVPTFMPAHAVPPNTDKGKYVDEILSVMLPAAAALQEKFIESTGTEASNFRSMFVDVFCDKGYFDVHDTELIFKKAAALGMGCKVHADEFESLGGTKLAMDFGAISADHLLKISLDDIYSFGKSDTIPVLLPGTSFFLNLNEHAPARKLIDAGAAVALGSDFNPGSCHIFSLPFIWGLACLHLKMTPEEALTALTINAAGAIGYDTRVGRLESGYQADITIYDVSSLEEISYNIGWNPVCTTIHNGRVVYDKRKC